MRLGGVITEEEIANEIRAVLKLCRGTHENIIEVLGHGKLNNTSYHFIDMELCDFNLESYIDTLWSPVPDDEKANLDGTMNVKFQNPNFRMRYIWIIMHQIACGVAYIHSQKEVHRDLKPRNSIPVNDPVLIV